MANYFEQLNGIDVSDKIEKKGRFNYLSWAWAWGELKKRFPKSYYTVYENEKGWNYFTDGKTAWVKTGVTVLHETDRIEHIEYLPIMDHNNRSLPLERITSFDVNKSIQRSLTKACARHGLGLYIYAGEDLPEEADEKPTNKKKSSETANKSEAEQLTPGGLSSKQLKYIFAKANESGIDTDGLKKGIKKYFGKDSINDITKSEMDILLEKFKKVS